MTKGYIRYSRKTQKLIYWLIADYANFQDGKDAGSKASSYSLYKAKKDIKKVYLKHIGYKSTYKPIESLRTQLAELFTECMEQEPSKADIPYLFTDIVMESLTDWVQELLMTLQGTFSLALALMSQKQANEFVTWLFEYCFSNDIPFRKEIMELYAESNDRRRVYLSLIYRKCCICGEYVKFPHHQKRANSVGGYKYDKGDLDISPLCSYHHSEIHNGYSEGDFKKKYPMYSWIKLNDGEIEKVKEVYPNYAENYKRDIELNKE
jgi:hypothetical protein